MNLRSAYECLPKRPIETRRVLFLRKPLPWCQNGVHFLFLGDNRNLAGEQVRPVPVRRIRSLWPERPFEGLGRMRFSLASRFYEACEQQSLIPVSPVNRDGLGVLLREIDADILLGGELLKSGVHDRDQMQAGELAR